MSARPSPAHAPRQRWLRLRDIGITPLLVLTLILLLTLGGLLGVFAFIIARSTISATGCWIPGNSDTVVALALVLVVPDGRRPTTSCTAVPSCCRR